MQFCCNGDAGGGSLSGVALHFSPHPDDELLGSPATLMELRDIGYRVVNVACSLGRPKDRARRKKELEAASELSGFEPDIPDQPVAMSSSDDLIVAEEQLLELVQHKVGQYAPDVVISPMPHDRHPGHELVGRSVRKALMNIPRRTPRWWMWGLWASLPFPTIGTKFNEARLREILTALAAYEGELERNDYRRFLRGRAEMNTAIAPELLFGLGAQADRDLEFVELLTEVSIDLGWWLCRPRWFEATHPLGVATDVDIEPWLFSRSAIERIAPSAAPEDQ